MANSLNYRSVTYVDQRSLHRRTGKDNNTILVAAIFYCSDEHLQLFVFLILKTINRNKKKYLVCVY